MPKPNNDNMIYIYFACLTNPNNDIYTNIHNINRDLHEHYMTLFT